MSRLLLRLLILLLVLGLLVEDSQGWWRRRRRRRRRCYPGNWNNWNRCSASSCRVGYRYRLASEQWLANCRLQCVFKRRGALFSIQAKERFCMYIATRKTDASLPQICYHTMQVQSGSTEWRYGDAGSNIHPIHNLCFPSSLLDSASSRGRQCCPGTSKK